MARELAKYLTKAIDLPDGKQGAGFTTWACKEGGGFRRRPWHRYWPSRPMGRAIRAHLQETAEEDAIKPPGTGWELVTPIAGVPTMDYPRFRARKEPMIPGCRGHLREATACCHGVEGLWKCICGGPAEVRPWDFGLENERLTKEELLIRSSQKTNVEEAPPGNRQITILPLEASPGFGRGRSRARRGPGGSERSGESDPPRGVPSRE